ncbi:MAG: Fe-S cluster assembly protein SufD [Bacteroidales bacterium]|nr:Fe-S cluster assembly protein SufD [Bacteroidales bacterium]
METTVKHQSLKEKIIQLFEENQKVIFVNDSPEMILKRKQSLESFKAAGFPTTKLEKWRDTDLSKMLEADYSYHFKPSFSSGIDLSRIFQCNIPHLATDMISQLNGWFVSENGSVKITPQGVIIGSLNAAKKHHPEIINKYLGSVADVSRSSMVALNTAFATDGTFIYVPDNVQVDVPMQMVNIIQHDKSIFIQNRNLIVLGRNAKLQLVQCDDSVDQQQSFTNTVTEVFLDRNSSLDHYKLQNKNNASTLINTVFFNLERDSRLTTNGITFNGGLIRNENYVLLNGENCEANIMGVYLMDRTQHVDNQVFVDHAYPNCQSNELFKGILDDSASAVFNGHIMVRRDAQKTNAYQNNKNILLTDKATVNTKPFLEIYADDVKCSHGATIGQLDQNAMFYLKSRGIGEANARLLLMYAFAAEVINHINIEPLKIRIDDMVKKRLRGELSICDQCVLHCSTMEKPVHFEIDMSKV